jgi:hypothetical protein
LGYDSPFYVVWPGGYSVQEKSEDVGLVDDSGDRVASVGDYIVMGGKRGPRPRRVRSRWWHTAFM